MRLVFVIISFVFFSIDFFVYSQSSIENKNSNFSIENWNTENGLPQNSINAMVQTKDGYIWIATFGGLTRFDGENFRVFTKSNTPQMKSDRILSLYVDKKNTLWIGAENNGLMKMIDGKFISLNDFGLFYSESIYNITEDNEDAIWFRTINGFIYKYKDGKFIHYGKSNGLNQDFSYGLFKDNDGFINVYSKDKFLKYINGKFVPSEFKTPVLNNNFAYYLDNNDTLWLAERDGNFYKIYKNNIQTVYRKNKKFSLFDDLTGLIVDQDGAFVFGSGKGISFFKDGKFSLSKTIPEIDNFQIASLIQDKEGNYWIGSYKNGLYKLKKKLFDFYFDNLKPDENNITSIFQRNDGVILFGTHCFGIKKIRNNKIEDIKLELENTCVSSFLEDSKGNLWVGTWGGGLYLFQNNKLKHVYTKKTNFPSDVVLSIFEDKNHTIWLGTFDEGIIQLRTDGKLIQSTTKNGLSNNNVQAIFQDKDNSIWIGTSNGLNKILNGGKITRYDTINGVSNISFRAIYQDKEGVLWFGTYGLGLFRLQNNKFTRFTKENGLIDDVVSQLVEDDFGYFWYGSNKGIFRLNKKELNDFVSGKIKEISSVSFGIEDGLLTLETNGGFQPSIYKTKDGRILFPTIKGIVAINPTNISTKQSGSPILIEEITSNNSLLIKNVHSNFKLKPDENNILIRYTSFNFSSPHRLTFRYKLEGLDKDWIDVGNLRVAFYPHIPPGNYTFKVKAKNQYGVWSEKPAEISFTVLPFFWETWWFRLILVLIFLSLGPIIYYRRVSSLQKEKFHQEEITKRMIERQESERKRIASELHDSLGQLLLVIKNRALMGLNYLNKIDKAEEQLKEISEISSEAINEVRNISSNLRPYQLDRIGLTKAIESIINQLSEAYLIKFNIIKIDDIDNIFDEISEIHFYRIIQETFNNIVKHSESTSVKVEIIKNENQIEISIEDNGKGFDMEKVLHQEIERGLGISDIIERTNILKGKYSINSVIGSGTKFQLIIPIKIK
ncbi:MAG: hypothetical protein STSR0008_17570 [Ignavibacterium sp.]